MQAIQTKFIGPTNTKGSRIKATCSRGSITIPFPHELSGDDKHRKAVTTLVQKFAAEDEKKYGSLPERNPWLKPFVTGELADNSCVHVFVS